MIKTPFDALRANGKKLMDFFGAVEPFANRQPPTANR
jgi:hypothetical protein